jgi:hypothetical protein
MQFKYLKSTRIKRVESLIKVEISVLYDPILSGIKAFVGLRCAREQPRILCCNALRLIAADWSLQAFNSLAHIFGRTSLDFSL